MRSRSLLLLVGAAYGGALGAAYVLVVDVLLRELVWMTLLASVVVAVAAGIRIHRPPRGGPWRVVAVAMGLLLLSNVLLLPEEVGGPGLLGLGELLELVAFPLIGLAAHGMVRRQSPTGDRAGALDGAVVMVALAAALSSTVFTAEGAETPIGRVLLIVAPVVLAAITAAAARLLLAGRPGPSTYLLSSAVGCALVGHVLRTVAVSGGSYARGGWRDLFIAAAYTAVGLAALHPSMRRLTTPAPAAERRLTAVRLGILGVALVTPPLTLIAQSRADLLALGASVVVSLLVLVRLWGLVVEREEAREELRRRAVQDDLTGLPNRREVLDHLGKALLHERATTVLFLDLDGFKRVNDEHGHGVGDQLLVAVAERVARRLSPSDLLGRLAGDEFVVVAEGRSEDAALLLAEEMRAAFDNPFAVDGRELDLGASIGLARRPAGAIATAETLLAEADAAMYVAKEGGGSAVRLFGDELGARLDRERRLERDLVRAAERGEMSLVYQPVRSLDGSGRVVGAEALLRWTHPDLGPVPADEVIRLADATGLIGGVGDWVLEGACRQLARWQREGLASGGFRMFVNFSPRQLADARLPDRIMGLLARTGVRLDDLVIELTETAVVDEQAGSLGTLRVLEQIGAVLALDDFGTGYSSLTHLQRVPFHLVKIDASFIADIAGSRVDRAIVTAVVGIARELGAEVVAEGIEDARQLEVVTALGCQLGQGHHLGRPVPAEELPTLLGVPCAPSA